MIKKLYRYESKRWSVCVDSEMEIFTSRLELCLKSYNIVSETPCGYWITFCSGTKDKWVSKTSRKRFAYPSKEEAKEAYRQRKLAYIRHSQSRLKRAKEELSLLDSMLMK